MPVVEVQNATKMYEQVVALRDVSLKVEAGEFLALVGKSGCGKSTLLNLCGAVDFPTHGEVFIDGVSTSRLTDRDITCLRREKVGFVFQSFQLLHTLSVIENVELPLLLARETGRRSDALERLRWVDMADYASRLPHQLSGGQQQRVAIARALVHNPKLILADEPTGNLDSATGENVLAVLRRVSTELGTSIVMATHSSESTAVVDRVIRMRDGCIVST